MSRMATGALSVVVALAACTDRTGTDDLSMSVSTTRLSLTPTQTATFHFTAQNLTDRVIAVHLANACRFTYEVRDAAGVVADGTPAGACSGPALTVDIPPFGLLIDSVLWPSASSRPAAGRYALRGFLGDDRRRTAGPLTIVLE